MVLPIDETFSKNRVILLANDALFNKKRFIFANDLINRIMVYIRSLLVAVAGLCLLACSHTSSFPETLLRAECLMDSAPNRAMTLLTDFKDSVRPQSEGTRMYYQLLVIKANDKCYVPHTSDSLIKIVVQYYEDHGTPRQLMEAYYYLGSTYRDMHDAPQALEYYQKAVDASESGKEYQLLGRIYNQIGMLYMYQKLYDEALPVLKKAYSYFFLAKDSVSLPYTLRDIGRAFTAQHRVDSTFYYYEAGYQAAKSVNDVESMSAIQGEMADIYVQLGRYVEAHAALIQSSAGVRGNGNLAPHYLGWADLYKGMGQIDSAVHYYRKALEIGNVYIKEVGYLNLYQIERQSGRSEKAFEYMDQCLLYRDLVQKITDTEAVKKGEMLYNYRHIERENDHLALANEKRKTLMYRMLTGVMVLLLVVVGVFLYDRKKKRELLEQEQRLRLAEERRYRESQEQIEQNNAQIMELNKKYNLVCAKNRSADEKILALQQKVLEAENNRIAAICDVQQELITAFLSSEIYTHVKNDFKNPGFKLTATDWGEIQKALDVAYNDFTARLYALYPKLSENELHVCYLLKMSFTSTDLAPLVALGYSSVCSLRERLSKKLLGPSGTAKQLDSFIASF